MAGDAAFEAVLLVGEIDLDGRLHAGSAGPARAPLTHRVRRHGARSVAGGIETLWRSHGLRPGEILVVDACASCPVAPGVRRVGVDELLRRGRRLALRERGLLPPIPSDPTWTIEVQGADPALERVRDTWLAMVDGVVGTLGSPLVAYAPARREVRVGGVYVGTGADSDLLKAPDWSRLAGDLDPGAPLRRVLDLRTGLLHHEGETERGRFRAVTFASRARPGLQALRATGDGAEPPGGPVLAAEPSGEHVPGLRRPGRGPHARDARRLRGSPGGVAVAAAQAVHGRGTRRHLDRVAVHVSDSRRTPAMRSASARLDRARALGIEHLMDEQRRAWSRRWAEMGIRIEGDPELQRAINFALFHLDASVGRSRAAPLGPRGLSGPSYRGHVFWDSEVFVLPFFAATRPAAARAMLTYRHDRLPAAQAAAREAGLAGAWFPWESAADGRDVTPPWIPGPTAQPVRVWTGERELHIVAAVAWAAAEHVAWSGDLRFAAAEGRDLLVETARFWASRLERDLDGSVHLRGIIGPDEYHELVDDNAYTNVMARWNLRAAAAAVEVARGTSAGGESAGGAAARDGRTRDTGRIPLPAPDEVADWLAVSDDIVDGYDAGSGIYEQFAGFADLEPVRIAEMTTRPSWGDRLLGRERLARSQVIKQADVLLLHHLVPDEVVPGSLAANLDYYDPRTAHGSSLSPATHAALLARDHRFDAALEALRMAAFMDLDDRNGTASEGLHIQAMGGLWQALVMGFAGVRPSGEALAVDPRLPPDWSLLEVAVRFRGRQVRVAVTPGSMRIQASGDVPVRVPGLEQSLVAGRGGLRLELRDAAWLPA